MYCYSHEDIHAVGICKSCGKAVCRTCAVDLGFAVACGTSCGTEAREINEMNQKAKRIYGIGTKEKRSSSQAMAYIILGVFLCLTGLMFFSRMPMLTYFTGAMGLLMVGVGLFVRQRMNNLGIQL